MTFTRPTLTGLIARAQANSDTRLPGADSRLRRSVLDVLARDHAGGLHGLYAMIDFRARFFPDPENSEAVARWASIRGLTRKAAVAATGTATATGSNGVEVASGTVLARANGDRYIVTADAVIAGGTATLSIAAEGAGTATDMDAGQPLTFVSPVAGVAAIVTVAGGGIAGGVDEETDAALSLRVYEVMRDPPAGGKASDYVGWAKEVAEVTRAWVYPNWDGLGTVQVLFVMDGRADIVPDSGDVAVVAARIAAERPVGADVTVAAPVADPLAFTIHLTPDTADVRAAVTASLRDLIAREAEPGGTLLITHIREAISIAAGESDHVLTTPTANVTAAVGDITVSGAITWS